MKWLTWLKRMLQGGPESTATVPSARDAAVERADALLAEAEEIETDPRSLHLQLEAGRVLLAAGETQLVVNLLQNLLSSNYQFGYYSRPQYDMIHAFIGELLDAHNDAWRLGALSRRIHGHVVGGGQATLLWFIADRQVKLGAIAGARASAQRLIDLTGEPDPKYGRWDFIRRDGTVTAIENMIRATQGLPPLPPPPPPPQPERPPLPPKTEEQIRKEELDRRIREAFDETADLWDVDLDLGLVPADVRAEAERRLESLLENHSSAEELSALAERARYSSERGKYHILARIALRMHELGFTDAAREQQRWLTEPPPSWYGAPRNYVRRQHEALDLLDPVLGPIPRNLEPIRRGDADYELDTEEELASRWRKDGLRHLIRAIDMRLARGDHEKAVAHALNAIDFVRYDGDDPTDQATLDAMNVAVRRAFLTKESLSDWSRRLRTPEERKQWRLGEWPRVLGWLGLALVREGDRDEARRVHETLVAAVLESFDDMELHFAEEARAGAVQRLAAALGEGT